MLRPESWTEPAGVSPVRVIAGEPGSRPRSRGEIRGAERGVRSLFGGSKHVGRSATRRESCSLVTVTMEEPSRSCHGEGLCSTYWLVPEMPLVGFFRGMGNGTCARFCHGTGETRLCSLVSKDRWYKPMVKASGAQRESDGVIVPGIAGRNPAGGKGPGFGHVDRGGKRKGMAGTTRPNHPSERWFAVNVREPQSWLWATAKQSAPRCCCVVSVARVTPCDWRGEQRGVGCVTMSRRPSVSRVRENRTHGLKGEWGNRPAMRALRP